MPIMVPIAATLGYDKVWFGMIAIVTIELGLLTPPFGMVVFAMKASLPPDVRIEEIFLIGAVLRGAAVGARARDCISADQPVHSAASSRNMIPKKWKPVFGKDHAR